MLDPQSFSEHEHHHISQKSLTWNKPMENSLTVATIAKKPPSGDEVSCESGFGFQSFAEFKVYGNPRRVCRICHRQFSSGRALGGHMRVHGPLFTPAADQRKRKLRVTEYSDLEAVVDVATTLSGEAYAPHVNTSKDLNDGDKAHANDINGPGADYYMAAQACGSIYGNPEPDDTASADKNPLYKLRHKPKKSRIFTNEDFSMEMLASGQGMDMDLSSCPPTERTRVCSVCGKAFWSWKALSGHMRCHPEREWRGVLPPDEKSGSRFNHKRSSDGESSNVEQEFDGEDTVDTEQGVQNTALQLEDEVAIEEQLQSNGDEKDCVSSSSAMEYDSNPLWQTGKRSSRKSAVIKDRSAQSSPQQDDDEPPLSSETTSLADLEEAEQQVDIPDFLFMLAEAAWTIEQETRGQQNRLQQGPPAMFRFSSPKANATGKQERQTFLFDSKDVSGTTKGTMKFKCSTCKKTFNSPQALGGHRASHKKTKGCFARTGLGEETTTEEFGFASEELALGTPLRGDVPDPDFAKKQRQRQQAHLPNTKGYECSLCHRIFSTGQALGGHKSRCHYTGEKVAEAAASVTSSNKQASERGNSSKLDDEGSILDLNLPASTNEDSEDGCAAVELHLFHGDHEPEVAEKGVIGTLESHPAELSLGTPWVAKHLSRSNSWVLEGRFGPAVEPPMVF